MSRKAVVLVLLALAGAAALAWWLLGRPQAGAPLTLYGNVDLRQINLAFNDSQRVAAVLVHEGERVHEGQVLARLDVSRLTPQVDKARALLEVQQQVLARLKSGNRPQEIAEASANVAAARADADNARAQYERMRALGARSNGRAISQQDLQAAQAASDAAAARLAAAQKGLSLEQLGPRREEIAQAAAQLDADRAELAAAEQQLADAQLRAPLDTVVRSRLIEPGDMASAQQPAFTLAVEDPKWVRAYVDEPDLGRVREGMAASVAVDSFPHQRFSGWVGFISPVAEFTPKSVETSALRS